MAQRVSQSPVTHARVLGGWIGNLSLITYGKINKGFNLQRYAFLYKKKA